MVFGVDGVGVDGEFDYDVVVVDFEFFYGVYF